MERMRLQKYIAQCGAASRRKAEELIVEGRVKVNGRTVKELGTTVDGSERITLDDKLLEPEDKKVYIMLNKPTGYVTTVKDQFDRKTVMQLLKGINERVYPVGRLDYDTSGLLIMTNDGNFAYKVTHPSKEINKGYIAEVKGFLDNESIDKLKSGVKIEDYVTAPAQVEIIELKQNTTLLKISIHEGKNRQVRKMLETVGHPVVKLKRISIGKLELGHLPIGKFRKLEKDEIMKILK